MKRTRVWSAILSVCMLISMLTCLVLPASATTGEIDDLLDLKQTLRFDENGDFKVLVLSDIHGKGRYSTTIHADSQANIKLLVERENPDLVILNGDNIQMSETEEQFRSILDSIVGILEEKQIPWAHVFGNHDDELYSGMASLVTKEQQQAIYESYDYCVSKDIEELYGVGTYLLPVLSSRSDDVAFNVWCMDSNSYLTEEEIAEYGVTYTCDFIRQDQIDWYTETSSRLENYYGKKIYGMMSFHIPLPEHETAWDERANYPYTGLKIEKVSHSDVNSGMFAAVQQQGDVKAIVTGHDHKNDFMVDYKGVKLCYAGTPSVNGYYQEDRLGARVFTVNEADPSNVETYMSYVNTPAIQDPIRDLKNGVLQDFSDAGTNFLISSLNDATGDAQILEQLDAKIVGDRGRNGSAALAFTRKSTDGGATNKSRNIELEVDFSGYGKIGNNKYMRVWVDFTGNDGNQELLPLTAAAGLITDYNYDYAADYSTDYCPGGKNDFYYLPEGGTEWETYTMTSDGCYGVVGKHEGLRGAKGWLAFPVKDMYKSGGVALNSEDIITGAYLFYALDYSNHPESYGEYVFVDDIALVEDYKVFTEKNNGEVVSSTGLVDVSSDAKYPNIKDGLKDGKITYKVTDRDGMVMLSDLVLGGNGLKGYTFIMANDIDMEWKNFPGIGCYSTSFEGAFDGNGFVVDNLLILNPFNAPTGLFAQMNTGTIRNLGIASGFVYGGDNNRRESTGSLIGYATKTVSVYNCWSAATVWGECGGGGLAGTIGKNLFNSYHVGSVYTSCHGGVLYGLASATSVKNSYTFADSVLYNGYNKSNAMNQIKYGAFGRTGLASSAYTTTANNAYVKQTQGYTSAYEANLVTAGTVACDDNAKEYPREGFAAATIDRLNTDMDQSGVPAGYTVKYTVVEGVDYPVITYCNAGGEVMVRRVAHTTDNVGKNTLAEKSELFKEYCTNVNNYSDGKHAVGEIVIKNAADLLALAMIFGNNDTFYGVNPVTRMGITGIKFADDIDMTDLGIFENEDGVCVWDSFLPIGASYANADGKTATKMTIPDIVIDGQGHVIKNWKCRLFSTAASDYTCALFTKIGGTTIKNLGMENALVTYDAYEAQTTSYHTRYGIMVGKACAKYGDATVKPVMENCWVTGKIVLNEVVGSDSYVDAGGGLYGWDFGGVTMNNCWSDVDADYNHESCKDYTKLSSIGHAFNSEVTNNISNTYYVATPDDVVMGHKLDQQTAIIADNKAEAAWNLNQKLGTYWTLNEQGGITKGTEVSQIRKVTIGDAVFYTKNDGKLNASAEELKALVTCTKNGTVEQLLARVFTADTEIDVSHEEETVVGIEATCTETGLSEGKKCSVCNKILVAQEEVAAKGHDRGFGENGEVVCLNCGMAMPAHNGMNLIGGKYYLYADGKLADTEETGLLYDWNANYKQLIMSKGQPAENGVYTIEGETIYVVNHKPANKLYYINDATAAEKLGIKTGDYYLFADGKLADTEETGLLYDWNAKYKQLIMSKGQPAENGVYTIGGEAVYVMSHRAVNALCYIGDATVAAKLGVEAGDYYLFADGKLADTEKTGLLYDWNAKYKQLIMSEGQPAENGVYTIGGETIYVKSHRPAEGKCKVTEEVIKAIAGDNIWGKCDGYYVFEEGKLANGEGYFWTAKYPSETMVNVQPK